MHTLVRRFIKTGVGFLALGLAFGLWLLIQRELRGTFPHPLLVSAHTHAILVGFVMSMIMGVALWLFPRPEQGDRVYRPGIAELAWWLHTTGTLGRVIAESGRASSDAFWLRLAVVVCGVIQVLGMLTFFATIWTRIRPVGSHLREAKGERF